MGATRNGKLATASRFVSLEVLTRQESKQKGWLREATTQRLSSATNPENGTVTYTYNTDGTLAQKQDAIGQQLRYVYDSLKRVIQIQHWKLSIYGVLADDPSQDITYTYDTPADTGYNNTNGRRRRTGLGRRRIATIRMVKTGAGLRLVMRISMRRIIGT